ncbi:MAG: VWA domain-containing protein [Euryarchaeota archaeon]|nr:VWA domain-containing protein [Euryarchaeota archaeon]
MFLTGPTTAQDVEITSISINPDQNPLIAGNQSQVHIIPYDQYQNVNTTVDMSLNILIYSIFGETSYHLNLTRAPYTHTHVTINQTGVITTDSSHNTSRILLTINSTIARDIYLTAITGNITNTSIITFTPAAPYSLTTLYDDAYTVNTPCELTVWAYDKYENPITNLTILFNATPPSNTTYNSPIEYLVSNSQVGVVAFEGTSDIRLGLTLLNSSDNKTLIRNTINDIFTAGVTAIGDGMADGNTLLKNGRTDAKKIMILLTDGKCTSGDDMNCTDAIADAINNSITVYTIGLGGSEYIDETLLGRIAFETGGKYFNAPSSSQLRTVYNSIAQDICDYDITQIEYGDEGFTPYDYETEGNFSLIDITSSYLLKFDAYDIDDTIENCSIDINGNYLIEIPVTGDGNWGSFEYNITHLVNNKTNIISFYNTPDYINAIRNVEILANNKLLITYPARVDLVVDHPYNCTFSTYEYEDHFQINETINDLKLLLKWDNRSSDLSLTLTSPTGHVYSQTNDSTGYYYDDREAVPIDVRSTDLDTFIISTNPDTAFTDETSIYVTSDLNSANDQASDESEVDPILFEIANTTGGEYYFAPNFGMLKEIFRGIAANITNFTADGPKLNLVMPHNYLSGTSIATESRLPSPDVEIKSPGMNCITNMSVNRKTTIPIRKSKLICPLSLNIIKLDNFLHYHIAGT